MESLLTGAKLADELSFFKQQAEILATQKIKYSNNYVLPLEHRPKRATLANIPVCEPPAGVTEEEPATVETIKITIKSTKPPLLFQLSASSTSTILTLKNQLAAQEPTAPSPDSQRWILKGKAMGDGKLLREFTVEDGSVVNLMVKAGTTTPLISKSDSPPMLAATNEQVAISVPELTLSSTDSTQPDTIPSILRSNSSNSTSNESDSFLSIASSVELWSQTYTLLKASFSDENEAKKVWEAWFGASLEWMEPSQKALIRDRVGVSAMGGEL